MSAIQLLNNLKELKVKLQYVDENLKISAPKGALDSKLVAEIKKNKSELITLLQQRKSEEQYKSITPADNKEFYPLSSAQKRLYILQQMDPDSTACNIPRAMVWGEEIDIPRVEQTFIALIQRHESFRTSFDVVNEQPVQRIHDDVPFQIERYDDISDPTAAIEKFVRPFDLSLAPLLRVGLARRKSGEYQLLVDMNHIISDGVSHRVLKSEFIRTYFNKELPQLRLQYKDFAQWQNSPEQRERIKSQEAYWLKTFSGELPVLDLPTDFPRPAVRTLDGDVADFVLDRNETRRIKQIARDTGTTLYMVLLSIYNILLSKISGQQDIIVGIPIAGRRHPDLERIIGMFVNILALRNDVSGDLSYHDFLIELKKRTLAAYENQEYQFENLVAELSVQRDTSRNPILDVVFNLIDQNKGRKDLPDEVEEEVEGTNVFKNKASKFDLVLDVKDDGDRLFCWFRYSTALFKESTIRRIIAYFKKIISQISTAGNIQLADIEILPPKVKEKKLKHFNAHLSRAGKSDGAYPGSGSQTMQEKLAQAFDKYSEEGAIEYGSLQISYAQLERKAAAISRWILDSNIRKGRSIGICCDDKINLIASIIGVMNTGCVFVPLDAKQPVNRLLYMIQAANVHVLLTDNENKERLESGVNENTTIAGITVIGDIKEESPGPALSALRDSLSQIPRHGTDHIYTYFTSGSGGRPNAIAGKNHSLAQFIQWEIDTFGVDQHYRISQLAAPGFDAFLRNVFTPLAAGAVVCIPEDRDLVMDGKRLAQWIDQRRVTLIHCVPTVFRLIDFKSLGSPSSTPFEHLKYVVMSGEPIQPRHLNDWFHTFGEQVQLVNCYGATETTIIKTIHFITPADLKKQRIPAGQPITGARAIILDRNLNVCDQGITGEIYIRTPFSTLGYLGNSVLNAQRFIRNPFSTDDSDVIYKTGDLGRELENGDIEIIGRIDKQVKIRGIRIELDEIKNQLLKHIHVDDAVILVKDKDGPDVFLSAYFTAAQKLSGAVLREFLSKELPDYMIPAYFIQLDAIPLTVNGKVDENALPQFGTQKVIDQLLPFLKDAYFDREVILQGTQIEIFPVAKQKQILLDLAPPSQTPSAGSGVSAGGQTLVKQFEKQVAETPGSTAVVFADEKISYLQLDDRAALMSRFFQARGITQGAVAAVLLQPSSDMIAAVIGILKAGGTYVALSPDMPLAQVETLLNRCKVSHVLTDTQLSEKNSYVNLQGLIDSDTRAKPLYTGPRQVIKDLDSLPIPNRSLVDYEKYHRFIGQSPFKNSMSLVTGRGCPFSCAYCHKVWPKTHGSRSGENMFEEIKLYYDMGVRRFAMLDDIFNLNREYSSKLFKLIIDNKMDLSLSFNLRSDLLTNDYIDLMVEAGATRAAMALETASPRMQKLIRKNLNIEKLRGHLEYICDKYPQLVLELYTMHGFPTETEEEAMMTLDFIKSIKWLHFPYVNILRIYQNTPMEKVALEYGISKESILASSDLAFHELPETLPFDKTFTKNYQATFLNEYFLNKQRLLHVLPHQMNALTEDEILQKYRSYVATDLKSINDILTIANIAPKELGTTQCLSDEKVFVPDINQKLKKHFTVTRPDEPETGEKPLKILLIDLSQYFSKDKSKMLYDVVEAPMGLLYVATFLDRELGRKVVCKVVKSRIDFNSYDELNTLLNDYQPDMIGLRTLTFYRNFLHRTVEVIKQYAPQVPVVVGGPYSTSDYTTILSDRNIDAAVVGEGENTFRELVEKTLENNGKFPDKDTLRNIKGMAFMPENTPGEQWARQVILIDALSGVLGQQEPGQSRRQGLPALPLAGENTPCINLLPAEKSDDYEVFPLGQRHIDHLMESVGSASEGDGSGRLIASCLFEPRLHQIFSALLRGASAYIVPHRFKIKGVELLELYSHHSGSSAAAADPVSIRMLTSRADVQLADTDAPMLPGDVVEETVLNACIEVLGIPRDAIRLDSDLFELGLHSLKATILNNKLHKALHVKIPLPEIFNNPTAGQLAGYIKGIEKQNYSPITASEEKEYYPLSSAQKRLYILQQMEIDHTNYNSPQSIPLDQKVDLEKLETTFRKMIHRHESLRTSFHMIGEQPVQRIQNPSQIEFSIPVKHSENALKDIINDFVRPFDLSCAPLLRVELVQSEKDGQYLLFDMHHIITDGTSRTILIREFFALYEGDRLPPLKIQYKDFSQWQNSDHQQHAIKLQEAYWLKEFSGQLPVLNLPTDNPRPAILNFKGNTVAFGLSKEEFGVMKKIAKQTGATLYMVILAIYNVLLAKLSGQDDIIVGSPIASRRHEDLQHIIGMFVNTLAMRNQPSGHKTFEQFMEEVKIRTLDALENQEYQFEELVERLNVERESNRNPIFDVAFDLANEHDFTAGAIQYNQKNTYNHKEGKSRFDISLIGIEIGEYMHFIIEYSSVLYTPQTIERFIAYFKKITRDLGAGLQCRISDIQVMSEKEEHQVLHEFNDTRRAYPRGKTIHQLFEEQVAKTPTQTAVTGVRHSCGSAGDSADVPKRTSLSYKELNMEVNRLAHALRARGIGPDKTVGIMLDRSIEMIVSVLATLKAGGAYLPVDSGNPQKRIDYMLNDANAPLLLTQSDIVEKHSFIDLQGLHSSTVQVKRTEVRPQIKDFENRVPIPDRSLVNYEQYSHDIGLALAKNTIAVQATRGCPYKCFYCHKIWPKSHIFRSAEHIFDEIKIYYEMGARRFVFVDDIFNLNIKNSTRFFQMVLKNKWDIQIFFPNGVRGDILTKDYIDLMVEAGTIHMALALETASPRLQKVIKKNLNVDKLYRNMEYLCEKHPHVISELFTMHGFPTESEQEARMTLDFIKSLKWVHLPLVNILKIYPNTDMANFAIENGISPQAIARSEHLGYHELPETLPFDTNFTLQYQAEFLDYILSKERLMHVLPHQLKTLTKSELLQKYNSFLPTEINDLDDLFKLANITPEAFGPIHYLDENYMKVPDLHKKMLVHFGRPKKEKDALKILLMDVSRFFSGDNDMLYDMNEAPLGLMYLLTYLNKTYPGNIDGKIVKSRVDFDNYDQLKALLEEFQPDLIGIRNLTFFNQFFHKTTAMIRHWGVDVPIVAGGPYATSDYKRILQDKNVDLVVMGEGEETFSEFIGKFMENGRKMPADKVLKEIRGIAFVPQSEQTGHAYAREILMLDIFDGVLSQQPSGNPLRMGEPLNLAYTMFTSGSTGTPKAVLVNHQNVVRLVKNNGFVNLNPGDNLLQTAPLEFDASTIEIFGSLLNGMGLHLTTENDILHPEELKRLIKEQHIDLMWMTAPLFKQMLDTDIEIFAGLQSIMIGGDALSPVHINRLRQRYPELNVINGYGPTENTTFSTTHLIRQEYGSNIPIGKPIANSTAYILDKYDRPVPIGTVGELCVGGDGVSRGYLNNSETTAEKYFASPFVQGDVLYRTGDNARWLPDGTIQFLGRRDHQVKIRGIRIELGEIESRLLTCEDIKEAVVRVKEDKNRDKSLCAYIVLKDSSTDLSEIKRTLAVTLPDYMVPARYVRMQELPLTPNGKIDRSALPDPELLTGSDLIAPANDLERRLVDIWSAVLNVEKKNIGVNSDFFELGGHSLKATILVSKIHKEMNIKIPLAEVFNSSTIKELAAYMAGLAENKYTSISPAPVKQYYELSAAQRRLFVVQQMKPGSTNYNIPDIRFLDKNLDISKIERVFCQLIKRHESFRTSFKIKDETPVQEIHDFETIDFAIENYDAGLGEQIEETFVRPFDLGRAPLLRVGLMQTPQYNVLLIDMHHIIADGLSHNVLRNEFMALYEGKELQPLRLQYKDYAYWQNTSVQREAIKQQEKYWLDQFADGVPLLNLPTDYPRTAVKSVNGDNFWFQIDSAHRQALKEIVLQEDVTPFMLLLALYNIALAKVTGQDDIVVGTAVSGRVHPDLESLVGMFVNMLALRNRPVGEKHFSDFLKEIRQSSLAAFDNQDCQFEDLVDQLLETRAPGRSPLFDVVFSIQTIDDTHKASQTTAANDSHHTEPGANPPSQHFRYKRQISRFDLTLVAFDLPDTLKFRVEYSTDLFTRETIQRFTGYFKEIIAIVTENKHIKLKDIQVSHDLEDSDAEMVEIDFGFGNLDMEYDNGTGSL